MDDGGGGGGGGDNDDDLFSQPSESKLRCQSEIVLFNCGTNSGCESHDRHHLSDLEA